MFRASEVEFFHVSLSWRSFRESIVVLLLTLLTISSVSAAQAIGVVSSPRRELTMQASQQTSVSVPSINMTTVRAGYEAGVAVNPADPSNIIVSGPAVGNPAAVAAVSFDGGTSWRFGNASSCLGCIVKSAYGFVDPVASFDSNGDAYVGTIDNGTMEWLFKSTDGGNSFLLTSPFLKRLPCSSR